MRIPVDDDDDDVTIRYDADAALLDIFSQQLPDAAHCCRAPTHVLTGYLENTSSQTFFSALSHWLLDLRKSEELVPLRNPLIVYGG